MEGKGLAVIGLGAVVGVAVTIAAAVTGFSAAIDAIRAPVADKWMIAAHIAQVLFAVPIGAVTGIAVSLVAWSMTDSEPLLGKRK